MTLTKKTKEKIDELAEEIEHIRKSVKALEDLRKEKLLELELLLDKGVTLHAKEVVTYSGLLSSEEVKEKVLRQYGDSRKITKLDRVYTDDGLLFKWVAELSPVPSKTSVKIETPKKFVSRTVYTVGDTIDFDLLKKINPVLFASVVDIETTETFSIDKKKLDQYIEQNPEDLSDLQKACTRGTSRTKLTIKDVVND